MQIHKIRLKNFKSFYNETTVDFEQLKGLYKISGQIGAGKTTISEGIIFGLYGSITGKNLKDLISWGEKHGTVELWCTCRGKNIYIHRELNAYGQSPMKVEVDGEEMIFTDKRNAQSQLEQDFLDTPRHIMELLCIISFNNFKSLSTLNTKDTKIFLDKVLGFDALNAYIDICKEEQSTIRRDIIQYQTLITSLNNQLNRLQNIDPVTGNIDEIKNTVLLATDDIKAYEQQVQQTLQPLKDQLHDAQTKQATTTALGSRIKKEIDFIKQGKCPTCGAPIDQTYLATKEEERAALRDSYKAYDVIIRDLTGQISKIQTESTKYIAEKKELVKTHENLIIRLEEQLRRAQLDSTEIKRIQSEIDDYTNKLEHLNEDAAQYTQLTDIFTTQVRQKILESFIPAINMKIKELAGALNMQYVPEYDSMFKCTIMTSGLQQIPASSLSTGQLKLVDMIIVLGILGSVISRVSSNVLFLDELFSNLDPRTRADLIGVLRTTIPRGTSILIVSHQDIDNELFDGQIRVRLNQIDGKKQSIITIEK